MRAIFASLTWAILFLFVYWLLPIEEELIVFGAWLVAVGLSVPFLVFLVPEVTGAVALDLLTGDLQAFSSGVHFKYPWERVQEENYFSLKRVTQDFTETYASKDGPMMHVKASYQYEPGPATKIERLLAYIKVDEKTIKEGFTDVVSSILSGVLGENNAEWNREHVKEIEERIRQAIDNGPATHGGNPTTVKDKLESEYGVDFKIFSLADIDYSPDFQEARSGVARAKKLGEAATAIQGGDPSVSRKAALNVVLVEQKKAQKNIFEFEGQQEGGLLAAVAGKFLGGQGSSEKGAK